MGHEINTLSHGTIDGSYIRIDVRYVNLDCKYVLPTLSLCDLVRDLASIDKKQAICTRITWDEYWMLNEAHYINYIKRTLEEAIQLQEYCKKVNNLTLLTIPNIVANDKAFLLSPQEEEKFYRMCHTFEVNVSDDTISFGEYQISPKEFGLWIMDLTAGGLSYWSKKTLPEFGRITRTAINNSKNSFFMKMGNYEVY